MNNNIKEIIESANKELIAKGNLEIISKVFAAEIKRLLFKELTAIYFTRSCKIKCVSAIFRHEELTALQIQL